MILGSMLSSCRLNETLTGNSQTNLPQPDSSDSSGVSGSSDENSNPSSDGGNHPAIHLLADHLLIDGTVHAGTDSRGERYEGVSGEPFDFKMSDYPVTWAIAAVHASLLLQGSGIPYSADDLLSIAIKKSRLDCLDRSSPNDSGCFRINETAYSDLQDIFGVRFSSAHSDSIEGAHFESSALAMAHDALFSLVMFQRVSNDPRGFFSAHPNPTAMQKVLNAADTRGLSWEGLEETFRDCRSRDVIVCFNEGGEPDPVVIDHVTAIAHYSRGLKRAPLFDANLTRADLENYWFSIKSLYPDADETKILSVIAGFFAAKPTLSFASDLPVIMPKLISTLPAFPTYETVTARACTLGYLPASPSCL